MARDCGLVSGKDSQDALVQTITARFGSGFARISVGGMRVARGNSELDLTDRGIASGGNVRAGVGHSPSPAANRSSPTDCTAN